MIALYFAGEFGKWAGPALTNLFFSRFDPFANLRFADAVSRSQIQRNFQTHRMLRCSHEQRTSSIRANDNDIGSDTALRGNPKLPAVSGAAPGPSFVCGQKSAAFGHDGISVQLFFAWPSYSFVYRAAWDPKSTALFETIQAIQKFQSGVGKLDAAHPLQLTVEDLAKASPLSKSTRRLLGDSHITLALDEPPHHGQFGCAENPQPSWPFSPGLFVVLGHHPSCRRFPLCRGIRSRDPLRHFRRNLWRPTPAFPGSRPWIRLSSQPCSLVASRSARQGIMLG